MKSSQEIKNKTFAIKARIKGLDSQITKKQRYLLLLPGGFGVLEDVWKVEHKYNLSF